MKCLKMVNIPPLVCSAPPPNCDDLHNSTIPNILEKEDLGSELDFQAFPPYSSEVLEVGDLIFKKTNFINDDILNINYALSGDGDTHLRIQPEKTSTLKLSKVRFLSLNHEIFSSISDSELFSKNCEERKASSMPEVNHLLNFSLSEELVHQRIPFEGISDEEPETMFRIKCKYSSHSTLENLYIHRLGENMASNSRTSKTYNNRIIEKCSETLEKICSPNKSECKNNTTFSKVVHEKVNNGLQKNCNGENDEFLIYYDYSTTIKPFELSTLENIKINKAENEDEFGDFEKALCIPENGKFCNCWFGESSIFNIDIKKLRICLERVLDIMFPSKHLASSIYCKKKSDSLKNLTEPNIIPFQELTDTLLTSIEYSSALAFNLKESSCRCALIKSLGVDSRNVHVGKNWSNPIFAIGLNTLPMKPTCNKKVENSVVGYINENVTDAEAKQSIIPSTDIGKLKEHQINNSTLKPSKSLNADTSIFSTVLPINQNECCADKKNDLDNLHLHFYHEAPHIQRVINGNNNEPSNERLHKNIFSDAYCEGVSTNSSLVQNSTPIANTSEEPIYIKSQNDMDVVVVSSTFSGPLKETHIYSPPEVLVNSNLFSTTSLMKPEVDGNPTIFNQDNTSAGIVIDETVVRKEYRDVEYHLESGIQQDHEDSQVLNNINKEKSLEMFSPPHLDFDDDFMEFQSAPTRFVDVMIDNNSTTYIDRMTPPHVTYPANETSIREVILNPAVLIPKVKVLTDQRNTIPHTPATNIANARQKIVPNYNTEEKRFSFGYNVVNKEKINEFEMNMDLSKGDEDWSDFVSVPPKSNLNYLKKNKVELIINQSDKSKPSTTDHEDDWSEFISNEISFPYTSSIGTSIKNSPCNSITQTGNLIANTSSSIAITNSPKTDNVSAQYNRSL